MKKVYFLSGFPRSGNTIISNILNQNKDMAVSGHSSLVNCFFNLEQVKNTCTYDNFKDEKSIENIKKKPIYVNHEIILILIIQYSFLYLHYYF